MRIMGVDLSITCTGVSPPDGGTLVVKPKSQGDLRLEEVADRLRIAATGAGVDLVVIEEFGRFLGEAAKIIPMLHGAVRLDLMRAGIPYMVLSPSSLKKFATGSGTADKTAMAMAAYKRLGREYKTSDECDADWLRVAGRFVYGLDVLHADETHNRYVNMPQVQRQALAKNAKGKPIVWPVVGGRKPWPTVALRT